MSKRSAIRAGGEQIVIRFWLLPLLLWVGFFFLFWKVKRWRWSVTKAVLWALGCALAAAVAVALFGRAFVNIFD